MKSTVACAGALRSRHGAPPAFPDSGLAPPPSSEQAHWNGTSQLVPGENATESKTRKVRPRWSRCHHKEPQGWACRLASSHQAEEDDGKAGQGLRSSLLNTDQVGTLVQKSCSPSRWGSQGSPKHVSFPSQEKGVAWTNWRAETERVTYSQMNLSPAGPTQSYTDGCFSSVVLSLHWDFCHSPCGPRLCIRPKCLPPIPSRLRCLERHQAPGL